MEPIILLCQRDNIPQAFAQIDWSKVDSNLGLFTFEIQVLAHGPEHESYQEYWKMILENFWYYQPVGEKYVKMKLEVRDKNLLAIPELKLPMDVKVYNQIAHLEKYKETPDLECANIFHLYDTGRCCAVNNQGFDDSRFFELWAFNSHTMQKCYLGQRDSLHFLGKTKVVIVRIFADGSTLVRTRKVVQFSPLKVLSIWDQEVKIKKP